MDDICGNISELDEDDDVGSELFVLILNISFDIE